MQTADIPTSVAAVGSRAGVQSPVLLAAGCGLLLLTVAALFEAGLRQGILALIGFGAGISLYHASFGFTSAWRRFLAEGRSVGVRAQILMLGATMLLFYPFLSGGSFLGQPMAGFVNPVGLALALGAFGFGIGMQLGGGCGSGTLYSASGGSTRMVVTLAAFIAGSFLATADPLGWSSWPALEGISIVERLGVPVALLVSLAALGGIYWFLIRAESARFGEIQPLRVDQPRSFLYGPWSLLAGALALAAVNIAILLVAGRPWGITAAFALWGAKLAALAGVDVAAWPYWRGDPSLQNSLFADVTSVTNFGLMLGALAAAALAGKYAPQHRLPWRSLMAAILGGLIMGIGARLATGCNIGAFFSGTASGSLHALVWLLFAIPGNMIGARLRPHFGL